MLLEPGTLESSVRSVLASEMSWDMSVESGKRRASLRRRRTEKAHLAEEEKDQCQELMESGHS